MRSTSMTRKLSSILVTSAMVIAGLGVAVVAAPAASAAPGPVVPITSTMPTADALPTTQIDGVAWTQLIIGTTVYVGGKFANARPAGAAAGTSLTPRANMLSYDIATGVLNSGFNPAPNNQVYAIAASPDGSRIYIGGSFTAVGGVTRNRIAAVDAATGAVISTFTAGVDFTVKAIVTSGPTVYVAGAFTSANGTGRTRFAAFSASNGALLGWAPTADATVNAMVMSPDGAIIAGGAFANVNGKAAYGLAKIDATSGALLPWNATNLVRDAGANSAILSLKTDGQNIFGSGYVFGSGGNLEGAFSADPATGNINYLEDCHGDTYDMWPGADAFFTVSHDHYCGNVGGFPQSDPWSVNMRHALAFTKKATGTAGRDPYGYYNFEGTATPSMIHWFPEMDTGSYTGKDQAAWSITGNSQYVLLGGEFPTVNHKGQQGLVRFAVKPIAPGKSGPQQSGSAINPTITTIGVKARVAWQANTDEDSPTLTYTVTRNGTQIYQTTAASNFWTRPGMGFFDTAVVAGTAYKYRLSVADPDGNVVQSDIVNWTAPASSTQTPYAQRVIADGAAPYWPMNEASGTVLVDNAGFIDADTGAGVTRGTAGAIAGDTATTFNGSTSGSTRAAITSPNVFTAQAWINTTSTSGGKILGFGNASTGTSSSYDRHIYMDNSGHVIFGVYPGFTATLTSAATYNDGKWHQISASLGADGMKLYVDDKLVGQRSDVNSGQAFTGYWRVGGDNLGGWPAQPSSNYFTGAIDEVAIYPTVLSRQTVDAQWVAAGRTSTLPVSPADAYGTAVFNDNPTLFWRLGEANGTTAADSGPDGTQTGTYSGGYTLGAPGAIKGTSNTAATFDGVNGHVASTGLYSSPMNYSEEAWFKTTSTSGGKIIGFGDQQNGQSNNYDRHVYMSGSGAVNFGVWTGQATIISSAAGFNDGQWHQVVATQSGTDGMKLYLDGKLVGVNGQTGAQGYDGYWRIGGDVSWDGNPYFAGTIDDAAVYSSVLSASAIANHYNTGSSTAPANQPPTAAFTSAVAGLAVSVDASASSDPDGTIASYAWNFGDGSTAGGATAGHTYAAGGTYTVTLTVTDNKGLTASKSTTVTVSKPNQAPTAAFTSTKNGLAVSVDASSSTDADGTIAGYSWNFGDGASATGATAGHTYAAAGTYTVSLTVTDNQGATGTRSAPITVVRPNQAPTATFTVMTSQLTANFDAGASTDADGTIASYAWNFGDQSTGAGASVAHSYAAAGTYPVTLTVTDDQGATNSSTQNVSVTAPPPNTPPTAAFTLAQNNLTVNVESTSTDPDPGGSIVATAWDFGDNSTSTDSATTHTYAAAGTYTVKLTVTDNSGASSTKSTPVTATAPPAPNKAPTAAFTTTANGVTISADGSGSSDPDGTIKSYAWDYGDGATDVNVGATATHGYTAAGTYVVTLTVTDNGGATASVSHNVTVTAAGPVALIKDAFGRSTTGGWGTADTGGAWTVAGGTANFSVAGGFGQVKLATAGASPSATIGAPSAADVDISVETSIDKVPTGGGVYLQVSGRKVGNSEYRTTVKLLSTGVVQLQLVKILNGTSTTLKAVTVSGLTFAAGDTLTTRMQISGGSSVALAAKVWKTGTTQPASWTAAVTDATSPISTTGSVALYPYLSGSSTNAPVVARYDNLIVSGVAP